MPRPIKYRKVESLPKYTYFMPVGIKKCELHEISIKVEELEAMRLKDIEELKQEECAERMHVSRQTFQNIIDSARKKVALALTEGKAINISGGNYTRNLCSFKCAACGKVYEIKYEEDKNACPACGSSDVMCSKKGDFCHKVCHKRCKNNKCIGGNLDENSNT